MDFTLSNARWFYSSMGNTLARKGLINSVKSYDPVNPLTAEWALRALIDFTLSNVKRFYSVWRQTILLVNGEPLGRERVK